MVCYIPLVKAVRTDQPGEPCPMGNHGLFTNKTTVIIRLRSTHVIKSPQMIKMMKKYLLCVIAGPCSFIRVLIVASMLVVVLYNLSYTNAYNIRQ